MNGDDDYGGIVPAQALDAISAQRARLAGNAPPAPASAPAQAPAQNDAPRAPATETIAGRMGAMVDEVDFPGFVAGLVHGTFNAVVDASIRQMESYSSLVAAVAKTVEQFTEENVSSNQARDELAQKYPGDLKLLLPTAERREPRLEPHKEGLSPAWLAEYGLEGQELSFELIEQSILPQVRRKIGGDRQQLLATMVMLGMNRVVVKDGSISAKVMFRAAASDVAKVGYATGSDPAGSAQGWGERGSTRYGSTSTMVSTVAVNAQSESSVKADLFGEVKLNFASETLPLEKLADAARIAMIQRNSPVASTAAGTRPPAAPPPKPDTAGGS